MSEVSRRAFLCTSTCVGGMVAVAAMLPEGLRSLPVHLVEGVSAKGLAERAFPIPAADGVNIDRKAAMILVRSQGKVMAFSLSCPHEHAPVKWNEKDAQFQCTKHDSKYQPNGKYVSGRSTRSLDRFPIRKDANNVMISLDRVFRADQDAAGWAAAEVAV